LHLPGLDVGQTSNITPPIGLDSHLDELGVLLTRVSSNCTGEAEQRTHLNHGLHDTEETFVRREETVSTSEGVALQPTLQSVLGEHLNDSTTVVGGLGVPLEIPVGDLETLVKLVGGEFVGREDSERLGVHLDDLGNVRSDTEYQLSLRFDEPWHQNTHAFMLEMVSSAGWP
jgi:hypothetical protein